MEKSGKARGFSLVEVVVVVSVILIIASMALPSVTRSLRTYRLSGAATDVANFLQRTRYEAIRQNAVVTSCAVPTGNMWTLWIDTDSQGTTRDTPPCSRGTPDPGEPYIVLPAEIQFLPQGQAPSPASMGAVYANAQIPAGAIAFDSRGTVSFGGAAPVIYVVYLGFPRQPDYGFRAVTLTPVGKTKVWSAGPRSSWHSP